MTGAFTFEASKTSFTATCRIESRRPSVRVL